MNPIRFGPPERELLGVYHRPAGGHVTSTACVLCSPFGQEAMRSHRVFRILAERLAASGFHVLRFDYFGTGDSGGEDESADIEGWIQDVLRADEAIMQRSGCTRSVWLGLKLGATLAAFASPHAARLPNRLVLWDPIVDGVAYLDELAAAHVAFRKAQFRRRWDMDRRLQLRAMEEAKTEVLGHPLTTLLRSQLGSISSASYAPVRAGAVSLFTGRVDGDAARLEQDLKHGGMKVRLKTTASNVDWLVNDMLGDSIIPADDVRSIIDETAEAL